VLVAVAIAAIVIAANASGGAYFSQSWGWVALAFLVPTTVLLILDRVDRPGRLRAAFVVLMGALTVWIGLSALWSSSVSASVRELERTLVYLAVVLGIALCVRRGDERAVFAGLLGGSAGIVSYGLATRLYPDRFGFDDDPFNSYRLAEPLGYWNSFGLLAAMGLICALGVVAHARTARAVIISAAALPLLSVALYFTFSRGSWVALGFGLAATVALDPRRASVLWSMVVVGPASVVAVVLASRRDALTTEDSTLAAATADGHRLAWILCALAACSGGLGWVAHRAMRRIPLARRARRTIDGVLATVAIGVVAGAVVIAGGPASAVDELRERFEAVPTAGERDLNDRLFSASGNGRAETIGVAWDVGREHPVAGAGSGTFEYLWYERRPSAQIVRDAHSLYAEVFGELGVIGLALLGGLLLVPCVALVNARRVRFVAPAGGAFLAWVAAAGLDWHWEMVGLTVAALAASSVGLLAAERGTTRPLGERGRLGLIVVTATASVLAVWSLVGNQALFAAHEAVEREEWAEARDDARRARALLIWSHEPELALGDAEAGRGDRDAALDAYRAAVADDPENWVAWLRLAQVASGAERAAAYDRVRALNPREGELPGE
jgi:O-antigen ligase